MRVALFQNPGISRYNVGKRRKNPATIRARMNFHMNLNHFSYGILATDNTAIRTPEQGVIMFVNPSPS